MSIPASWRRAFAHPRSGSTASNMSTTTSADLTDIVLLLANFTGVPNMIDLSDNAAFEFKPPSKDVDPDAAWLGDLSEEPASPILCLEFRKNMFSPTFIKTVDKIYR